MSDRKPLAAVPRGIVDVPVTPFTPDNKVDLDTFGRVIEFLLGQNASSLCINLHLAESLNLTIDERKLLAKSAVEFAAGRVPVIVHVSMPGTDQAVDLARHAEEAGADCVIAIAPYYWKPSQESLYAHFSAIMSATGLPFIAYSSPTIMDGIGIAPSTLVKLIERFPKFIGLKEASHNWEKYLELGRAAKTVRPDFGLFDGRQPEFLQDLSQNPRVQQIKQKVRTATKDGKPVPKMKMYNVRDGIFEAMLYRFAIDSTMVAFGEENRDWGGAFAVYRGLTEALPYHRLFNSPISE